ncbi:MAG: BamA/TamA family outer membrane protein [Trueperaceae bacterium]|nr:MAG: BamA/TamA family outer membrane protein [Trueperaceae bacterium]
MPYRRYLALLCLYLGFWSFAQPSSLQGTVAEVRVEGTENFADLVRVIVSIRPGTPLDGLDLEAERNRVLSLGTFAEVSLSLEDRGSGTVLVIDIEENPPIAELRFEGAQSFSAPQLADALNRENLLAAGRVLNTVRAEDAIQTIQQLYRGRGFPFDVAVTLAVEEVSEVGAPLQVALIYTVQEEEPLDEVRFDVSSILDEETLSSIFKPLLGDPGSFDLRAYQTAVDTVAERYRELGYRESGVDLTESELREGILTVRFRELRIISIDTTAIGVDPRDLSLAPGDLFNVDILLEDVRRLAMGRSSDVRLVPRVTRRGEVQVTFELGAPATAGPIDEIRLEGNTVISTEELLDLLGLGVGDTFSSTLASEDFARIRGRYFDRGYLIVNRPDFAYREGTYLQRITELKIAGYRIRYEGEPDQTQEFVITRYLPRPGSVYNIDEIRSGLLELARLNVIEPLSAPPLATDSPDQVLVEVVVRDTETGLFSPAAQYATDSGFSASVGYSERNFLGRAHSVGVQLTGESTDVGLMFGGDFSYTIPWLYLDEFDFREVPTTISAAVFSQVSSNQTLTADGNSRVSFPGFEGSEVFVGEFAVRETGARISFARPVYRDTSLRFSARGSVSEHKLEPPSVECDVEEGQIVNADVCSLPRSEALQYLPQGGFSSFISTTVSFDNRDNPSFPREGIAARTLAGLGLGSDARTEGGEQQNYVFQQVEFGIRTYATLEELVPAIQDPNHVFAVKLDAGHQFGNEHPVTKFFRVGKTPNEATAIRGYQIDDFNLSKTFFTGSVEYRYDLGLSTAATQTVIGILFVDLGWASSVPGFSDNGAPLFAGAGVGVQINLGFGGVLLPALRFDYGFSERNPSGEFRFRIGPVF